MYCNCCVCVLVVIICVQTSLLKLAVESVLDIQNADKMGLCVFCKVNQKYVVCVHFFFFFFPLHPYITPIFPFSGVESSGLCLHLKKNKTQKLFIFFYELLFSTDVIMLDNILMKSQILCGDPTSLLTSSTGLSRCLLLSSGLNLPFHLPFSHLLVMFIVACSPRGFKLAALNMDLLKYDSFVSTC